MAPRPGRLRGLDILIAGDVALATLIRDALDAGGHARSLAVHGGMPTAAQRVPGRWDAIVFGVCDDDGAVALASLGEAVPDLALVAIAGGTDALSLAAQVRAAQTCDVLASDGLDPQMLGYAVRHAALTARRMHERRAHATELRTMFDLAAHAMWVFDPLASSLVAANRAAIESYGYSEEEFRGMSLADLRESAAAPVQHAQTRELPAPGATVMERHRRRDGSAIDVELFSQDVPLWGRSLRLVQARDITAERHANRALESSERRFRDFFEHSTGFICIHDLDGILISVNPAAAAALGYSIAELLGSPLRNLSPPELRFLVDNYLQRIGAESEDSGYMRVQSRDGAQLVWQYRNRIYVDADGASYVMAYAQDITALRNAEQAFRLSERRLRTIADTLPLKIAYVDAQQRIGFANEAYRYSYAPDGTEVVGLHARELLGEHRYAQRLPFLERALRGERVVFLHEEGEGVDYACIEISFIPELPENGSAVIGVHVMMQDVTARKREEQRLTRLSRIDDLTGVLNRASFYERLDNALMRSRDQDSLLSVFYLDIDHFKQVNDTHGHAAGDALIRAFAMRLADKVRASDVVARLGGDEFAIMMEGARDAGQIRAIADQLVASLQRPFELREVDLTLTVSASAGIALCRGGGVSSAQIVARADAMLYESKAAGRGTWRLETMDAGHHGVG